MTSQLAVLRKAGATFFVCAFGLLNSSSSQAQGSVCGDPSACNFNPEFTVAAPSCVYPPAGLDCAGNCIYPMEGNDACFYANTPIYDCQEPTVISGLGQCVSFTETVSALWYVNGSSLVGVAGNLQSTNTEWATIRLICPNNISVFLKNIGSGTMLGEAAESEFNPTETSIGYNYIWSTLDNLGSFSSNGGTDAPLPEGVYASDQPLSNLSGCVAGGNWTVEVCTYSPLTEVRVWDFNPIILNSSHSLVEVDNCQGCTHPLACNYNPDVEVSDASCIHPGAPCDDNSNLTYNDTLNGDCQCVGTPVDPIEGCTNTDACNYNPEANVDDGQCILIGSPCDDNEIFTTEDTISADCECAGTPLGEEYGCTDPEACNFSPVATINWGECYYATPVNFCGGGCLYPVQGTDQCFYTTLPDYTCFTPVFISETAPCYQSTQSVSGAPIGSSIGPSNRPALYIHMEHSFGFDLNLELTCPNGQSVLLLDNNLGGYFGEPIDVDAQSLEIGVGYGYIFADLPGLPLLSEVYQSNITTPSGAYALNADWSALDGCPINGQWELNLCDFYGSDDGYLWDWQLLIDDSNSPYIVQPECAGCTDEAACNYNPSISVDNGSCAYLEPLVMFGPDVAIEGTQVTYACSNPQYSTFIWEVDGGEIVSGGNDNIIEVIWNTTGEGSVCVTQLRFDGCLGDPTCTPVQIASNVPDFHHPQPYALFPNPASTAFTVAITHGRTVNATLHDANGRCVREYQLTGTTIIPVTDVAPGVYTFALGGVRERIVIVH